MSWCLVRALARLFADWSEVVRLRVCPLKPCPPWSFAAHEPVRPSVCDFVNYFCICFEN